jgi:Predicted membrane protein
MNPFSSSPFWQQQALSIIRIITGLFMAYHGLEIFDQAKINEYAGWDSFKNLSYPLVIVYAGKGAEFIGGMLLAMGLITRIAAVLLAATMLYVSLFVGHGKIWYEDQHPFLFVLLCMVFIFLGPGKWSLDHLLFKRK